MAKRDERASAATTSRPDAGEVVRLAARAFERDRYLSALLAPRAVRDDLIAVAAFAGEIGRIPTMVSEPMIGRIRLQWWRDALEAGAAATGNPAADALIGAAARHCVPSALLHAAIDAVETRLDDQPFADLLALTRNVGGLDGTLFRLAHLIHSGDGEAPLLMQAGEIYGLARVLVEAPAELAQGRVLLPRDMMQTHGCSTDHIRAAHSGDAWRKLARDVSAHVHRRLQEIAPHFQRASADVRSAILPLALVRPYLQASQRADIASLEVRDVSPLIRVWRLWLAHRFARI